MKLRIEKAETCLEDRSLEVVERKGVGHPDSLCDALAEELSRAYSVACLQRHGRVLHHNVDAALLVGGQSAPRFGGGAVLHPMTVLFAGRAAEIGAQALVDLATHAAQEWLARHMHALDVRRHVRVRALVRPSTVELAALAENDGVALANDTSIGAGSWPPSPLERAVLRVSERLARLPFEGAPHIGEDTKVLGLRQDRDISLTVSCAFVDRFVQDADDYVKKQSELEHFLADEAAAASRLPVTVCVNAADDAAKASFFLTVTGTSAEHGDDGATGRGNRVSGLVSPLRPMSIEAAAGKNPVNHIGKLYNVLAVRIARAVVEEGVARSADVLIVSAIGKRIDDPEVVDVRVTRPASDAKDVVQRVVQRAFDALPTLTVELINGRVQLF